MPEAIPDKPVFIDQIPDYQQAMQSLVALAQDEKALANLAKKLGLDKELEKTKATISGTVLQAQEVVGRGQQLDQQETEIKTRAAAKAMKAAIFGNLAVFGGGTAAGVAGGRRWGVWKGVLVGLATASVAAVVWGLAAIKIFAQPSKESHALEAERTVLETQKTQLINQSSTLEQQFLAQMATKMLEEQKMLVGNGAEAKLVSTAAPQATMAAKYAPPAAATRAEAMAQSQAAAVPQR